MTQHVVKLLRGNKRNPTRTLDLASGLSTGSIFLRAGGFSPGPGPQAVIWSGQTGRRHGQRRISSSRDNMQVSLTVDLKGTTAAELGWLAREIQRFFLECRLYEEGAEGEKIWLEYRWQDGLDDLPAPVFGQFSHYLRILDGQIPAWPGELHNGALTAGQIEGVVAELTCAPFAEGLPQRAADLCGGRLFLTNNGVVMAYADAVSAMTNYYTNPSFGHATWDTDWSVSDADLKAVNETRSDFVRSLDSGAHLVNLNASAQTFAQDLSALGTGPFNVSCYVRKADGTAPTSSDVEIVINDSAETTTFVQIDDTVWYLAYAQANGHTVGTALYGVDIKAGREVWIDDAQLELKIVLNSPQPFMAGYLPGCAWSGTAHASTSTGTEPTLRWTLSDQLAGEFTAAGWWTPLWGDDDALVDMAIVEYYVDINNSWVVYFDYTADRFEASCERDGVTSSGNGSTQSFSYGDHFHIAVRQDTTTFKVYVNGSEDISIDTAVGQPSSGILQLGRGQGTKYTSSAALDGWHIWRQALTATQVDALYDSEKPIKDSYGSVGMPPFLWTEDGDSILDNVDDSSRNNWTMVGGITGDIEANTQIWIDPPASPVSVFWLGRKATDEPVDPGHFWLELQGSADGNSSGGEYEEIAAGTSDDWYGDGDTLTTYLKHLPGRYQFLSRFYVATNELVVRPAWDLNSSAATADVHMGDEVTVGTDANFLFRDFGDMTIRFPDSGLTPTIARFMLRIDRTSTATVRGDFVMMLPYPAVRCEAINTAALSFAASEMLIITDDEAYSRTSVGYVHYLFERRGDPVTLVPNKYNYIWLLQGEEGAQYDVTDTATVYVYITPRWLLPGGAVA